MLVKRVKEKKSREGGQYVFGGGVGDCNFKQVGWGGFYLEGDV